MLAGVLLVWNVNGAFIVGIFFTMSHVVAHMRVPYCLLLLLLLLLCLQACCWCGT